MTIPLLLGWKFGTITISCSIPSSDVPYINNFDIVLNPLFLFLDIKKSKYIGLLDLNFASLFSIFNFLYIKIDVLELFIIQSMYFYQFIYILLVVHKIKNTSKIFLELYTYLFFIYTRTYSYSKCEPCPNSNRNIFNYYPNDST